MKIIYLCLISALLAACSGGRLFNKEKKYTPLYVYYNPLNYNQNYDFAESFYPDYINYPDDRVKYGLRGNVSLVLYGSADAGIEYIFDNEGKLRTASSFWDRAHRYIELREFRYTDGRLTGVYRNPQKNKWATSEQKFEYDAVGHLVRREGGMQWAHQVYSYYEDGTLKAITPEYYNTFRAGNKGKMDFDQSGNLVRAEADITPNPFMAKSGLPSISTFTYDNNGLCTEKLEKIYDKEDTTTCRHIYTYNEKGDLASWEYLGDIYQMNLKNHSQNVYISNVDIKILFEYEYDKHDNWTTIRITLPDNVMEIECLIWELGMYMNSIGRRHDLEPGEKPVITYQRHIEYYAFSAEEKRKLKKKNTPKFTAAQGRGLYGDIKSVTNGEYTINFDEYGNVISETWNSGGKNIYDYESPLRYALRPETGPFIGPFRIICEGNIRKEEDEKGIEGITEYEFDKHGRVIRYRHSIGMSPVTEIYTYDGQDKYPATMTYEYSYEEGTDIVTCKYTYVNFDKQGNWTKRKVNRTWECEEYFFDGEKDTSRTTTKTDPEFTETRTISYY